MYSRSLQPDDPYDLGRLLPRWEPECVPVRFRTAGGFQFYALATEADELGVLREYEVWSPRGDRQRCTVHVSPEVRHSLGSRGGTDQDRPLWDLLCKAALSRHLAEHRALPPAWIEIERLTPELQHLAAAYLADRGRARS